MDAITEDEVTRLRMALLRLARRLRQQVRSGITASQLSALATIERHGPLTLGELASLENVQPPTISRIVGALEGEGWVERTTDEHDRRVALVQATASARRELRHIRAERNAWLATRVEALPAAERRKLLAALGALERLFDEEHEQR
jgi:DNA-binding MarR family transcriptional regulator